METGLEPKRKNTLFCYNCRRTVYLTKNSDRTALVKGSEYFCTQECYWSDYFRPRPIKVGNSSRICVITVHSIDDDS
jgi:YHS domain-containing protein